MRSPRPGPARPLRLLGLAALLLAWVVPMFAQTLTPLTGTLAAAPEPSVYSNFFTLTASFNAPSPGPTGTVTFAIDGTPAGSAPLSNSTASLPVPSSLYTTLAGGNHILTATYPGDGSYAPAALSGSHTITPNPTSLSLVLCVDPPNSLFPCGNPIGNTPLISPVTMFFGQSLDGAGLESSTTLTGTITFFSGSQIFCTLNANLQAGSNTCPPASGFFPAGTTTVYATYSGDSNNLPSTSNAIVVTVFPDSVTATITSSLNPSTFGQSVTFNAAFAGNFATPTGPVTFYDGPTPLFTTTLDPTGQATFTTSALAVGTHRIGVVSLKNANFDPGIAAPLSQVVLPVVTSQATSTSLASSFNPSNFGQSVTFTAAVTVVVPPGTPQPVVPGSVTFTYGGTILATVPVAAGNFATFTTSTLSIGTHPITASYNGAGTILGSTSPTLNQVVNPQPGIPSFTLTVTPAPLVLGVGRTGILLATVTTTSNFTQTVQLSCSGLAPETACNFIQPILPKGGGSTTLQLFTNAPRDCGSNTPYFLGSLIDRNPGRTSAATLLAALILFPLYRRRRLLIRALLLPAAAVFALTAISGCSGHCTDLGTRPGNYTFTVTAVAQGGPSTQTASQAIQLTMTIP